ncbi:ATP-binding protein [Vibrio fluvialis]|nr:ATP-binding protein [Vibrio fluvialis]
MKITNHINKIAFSSGGAAPQQWHITSAKQMNFFIGPNNSGKSRMLRNLFSLDKNGPFFDSDLFPVDAIIDEWKVQGHHIENALRNHTGFTIGQFISAAEKVLESPKPLCFKNISNLTLEKLSPSRSSTASENYVNQNLVQSFINKNEITKNALAKISSISWKSVYIPTIRSLRHIDDADLFCDRTIKDYFPKSNIKENLFTGHSLYEDLKRQLLGTHQQRQRVREYELYLSRNFFFGQDISLVPRIGEDIVYFKEGDKEERQIFNLGDGIQSIIILTYPVFMATSPTMFFIEEPEHYLHAGLQRTLIETYSGHEEHMFFMTTHSNHFLDIAQERDDISIQQVRQDNGVSIVTPANKFEELLSDLGVRASSVLLANCSIWVEGITDKLYLRTYLRKYINELKEKGDEERANMLSSYHENLHFVFTEYQGSNITHWYFGGDELSDSTSTTPAKKLNNKILLIADADIDSKGDRVETLKQNLGNNFVLLQWKEIENYIPHSILLKTAQKRWDTFNGKDGCTFNKSNIIDDRFKKANEGIGTILERYVVKPKGLERKFFSEKSGTIKDKVKFCQTALEVMNEEDWSLTPELEALCQTIWQHIENSN